MLSSRRRIPAALASPTIWYAASLAANGLSVFVTLALPTLTRGQYSATTSVVALASAAGGLSLDTFLLARPIGWMHHNSRKVIRGLEFLAPTMSAALAALLSVYSRIASTPIATIAAFVISWVAIVAASHIRRDGALFVYRARFVAGASILCGFLLLAATHLVESPLPWLATWLTVQLLLLIALRVCQQVDQPPEPFATTASDVRDVVVIHVGVIATVICYRFDQVVLARYQGATQLAVYALAVSVIEFSQASSVIQSQRILSSYGSLRIPWSYLRAALYWGLTVGILACALLGVIGWIIPDYIPAVKYALALFPGSLSIIVTKITSAALTKAGRAATSAFIGGAAALASAAAFIAVIPRWGALGASLASSGVYALQACATTFFVRRLAGQGSVHPAQ